MKMKENKKIIHIIIKTIKKLTIVIGMIIT